LGGAKTAIVNPDAPHARRLIDLFGKEGLGVESGAAGISVKVAPRESAVADPC
jgi:hypothetical protein